MPSKENDQKKKSNLIEIRDILKNELNKFSSISSTLKDTSEGLNNIDSKYNEYNKEIDESKLHIMKLKRREFFENLFIYIALAFYFCCVIYITLKRFPVHKIIFLFYRIVEYISNLLYAFTSSVVNCFKANKLAEMNKTIFNKTDTLDYFTEIARKFVNDTINSTIAINETVKNLYKITNKTEF